MNHVHGRLDGGGEPALDLPEVEQARHGAGERADGTSVVVALPEERAVHQAPEALAQRIEGEGHREHEGGGEPRGLREIGLGEEQIGPGDGQGVGGGDEAGERRVDHGAPDDHGGVEEAVAHGGVGDGERVEEHEGRAPLRIEGASIELGKRREHEQEPATQAQADAEEEHGDLLVHEGRGGAPPRVEERGDLDGKGQRGEGEESDHGDGVDPSVDEKLGRRCGESHEAQGGERSRGERSPVQPRDDPVAARAILRAAGWRDR
jgi:hypothetical protein